MPIATGPEGDTHYAIIDLEFEEVGAARAFLTMLEGLWQRVAGTIGTKPSGRILETVEAHRLDGPGVPRA
ncbi:MAG: hypothetical protein HY908_36235 [Myxococcales bacterium]|nr:hypothetical protein [Myxococcales bacterium]